MLWGVCSVGVPGTPDLHLVFFRNGELSLISITLLKYILKNRDCFGAQTWKEFCLTFFYIYTWPTALEDGFSLQSPIKIILFRAKLSGSRPGDISTS